MKTQYDPNKETFAAAKRRVERERSWLRRLVRRASLLLYDWRAECAQLARMSAAHQKAQPYGKEMDARQWAAVCMESAAEDYEHA